MRKVRGACASGGSAAAHGNDDLQTIAVGSGCSAKAAARHDLAVALEGDRLPASCQPLDQLGDGERTFEAARLAVDSEADHARHTRS